MLQKMSGRAQEYLRQQHRRDHLEPPRSSKEHLQGDSLSPQVQKTNALSRQLLKPVYQVL